VKNENTYSTGMKFLHWIMAGLIISECVLGFLLDEMVPAEKMKFMMIHKSIGFVLLVCIVLRLVLRFFHKPLNPVGNMFMRFASSATIVMLYMGMLVMPLSGYMMSVLTGHPIEMFNLFTLPSVLQENLEFGYFMHSVHVTFAIPFFAFICLHIAAAIYHKFIKKDGIMERMLLRRKW
jgi:cytochrome b561